MRKKRYPLSLLEVIIAMSLSAVLIAVLFNFFRQGAILSSQMEEAKHHILSYQLFQERFDQIFNEMVLDSEKEGFPFYTAPFEDSQGLALFFNYNNKIDPNPIFCENVKGMLMFNYNKEVYLITTSKENTIRKEVFFEKALDFKFSFFDVEEKSWVSNWSKEKKAFPSMIKLTLYSRFSKKEPTEFNYFLTARDQEIIYRSS